MHIGDVPKGKPHCISIEQKLIGREEQFEYETMYICFMADKLDTQITC